MTNEADTCPDYSRTKLAGHFNDQTTVNNLGLTPNQIERDFKQLHILNILLNH